MLLRGTVQVCCLIDIIFSPQRSASISLRGFAFTAGLFYVGYKWLREGQSPLLSRERTSLAA